MSGNNTKNVKIKFYTFQIPGKSYQQDNGLHPQGSNPIKMEDTQFI